MTSLYLKIGIAVISVSALTGGAVYFFQNHWETSSDPKPAPTEVLEEDRVSVEDPEETMSKMGDAMRETSFSLTGGLDYNIADSLRSSLGLDMFFSGQEGGLGLEGEVKMDLVDEEKDFSVTDLVLGFVFAEEDFYLNIVSFPEELIEELGFFAFLVKDLEDLWISLDIPEKENNDAFFDLDHATKKAEGGLMEFWEREERDVYSLEKVDIEDNSIQLLLTPKPEVLIEALGEVKASFQEEQESVATTSDQINDLQFLLNPWKTVQAERIEDLEKIQEFLRNVHQLELRMWIDKEDYLLERFTFEVNGYLSEREEDLHLFGDFHFSDFDQDLEIQAPEESESLFELIIEPLDEIMGELFGEMEGMEFEIGELMFSPSLDIEFEIEELEIEDLKPEKGERVSEPEENPELESWWIDSINVPERSDL